MLGRSGALGDTDSDPDAVQPALTIALLTGARTVGSGGIMSQVRVHNFSISLDGFGTGEGLTVEAPFGHAGERLHEWMLDTRFWRAMVGEAGGGMGVDHAFAERHGLDIGAEIMGRGKFG